MSHMHINYGKNHMDLDIDNQNDRDFAIEAFKLFLKSFDGMDNKSDVFFCGATKRKKATSLTEIYNTNTEDPNEYLTVVDEEQADGDSSSD